jgi:hypothetical protein
MAGRRVIPSEIAGPRAASGRRHANCVVPPHMLEQLAQNGSQRQRKLALRTLLQDASLRSVRIGAAQFKRLAPRQLPAGPVAGAGAEGQRIIYDADKTETLPGRKVRAEGDGPTGDDAVDEAYDGLGATYDLYAEAYGRDSIDNAGMAMKGTTHYGDGYDNAFWDGTRMIFGDGDGELFRRFTISLDVIGHELTHGVTENEAGLIYWGEAGALNESISDVFGSLVKQFSLNETVDAADWLIGEGLFTGNVNGVALRSLKEPGSAYDDPVLGKDPQPANMSDYVHMMSDNGGVHVNSGIPNNAFYRIAADIGGNAWESAGLIWYATLRHPMLTPRAGFQGFARLSLRVARRLFGPGSSETRAVQDGWSAVGVALDGGAARGPVAPAARYSTDGVSDEKKAERRWQARPSAPRATPRKSPAKRSVRRSRAKTGSRAKAATTTG